MQIHEYGIRLNGNRTPMIVKEASYDYADGPVVLQNPQSVEQLMNDLFQARSLAEEYVWIIALDSSGHPVGVFELSHGTANQSFMNTREIYIRLLLCGAVNFIMVHNHPSGDTKPSKEDIATTERVKEAGKLLGINMLDHIIIGDSSYSFASHDWN